MGFVKLTEQFLRNLIDHSSSNVAREGLHGQLTELVQAQAQDEPEPVPAQAQDEPVPTAKDISGLGSPSEGAGVGG